MSKGFTFGYKSNEFLLQENVSNPGVGTYNLNTSYESLYKNPEPSIGKAERFNFSPQIKTSLGPGYYKINKFHQNNLPKISFPMAPRFKNINSLSITETIGPGSYNIGNTWTPRNALPFNNTENEEFIKIIRQENTPGPGSYAVENEKKGKSLVFYSKINKKEKSKEVFPGPGAYVIAESLNKSISFPKATKESCLLSNKENNKNVGPTTYEVKSSSYNLLAKKETPVSFSFPQTKRMPSLPLLPAESYNINLPSIANNKKGITFTKAEKKTIYSDNNNNSPGPCYYKTDESSGFIFKPELNAKNKMKQLVDNLKRKAKTLENEQISSGRQYSSRKSSLSKRLKPFLKIFTKNKKIEGENLDLSPSKKKNIGGNKMKAYILQKIQKNVEKQLQNKLNKEIFILSNEAQKKRKNKGFTTSQRKYEFLNLNPQIPGPEKYDIKRELNPKTLPLRASKKITIFGVENYVPAPNTYNIGSPFDNFQRNTKSKEKNKTLIQALRKIQDINRRKKNIKKNDVE